MLWTKNVREPDLARIFAVSRWTEFIWEAEYTRMNNWGKRTVDESTVNSKFSAFTGELKRGCHLSATCRNCKIHGQALGDVTDKSKVLIHKRNKFSLHEVLKMTSLWELQSVLSIKLMCWDLKMREERDRYLKSD
jgi:hypothetical protein